MKYFANGVNPRTVIIIRGLVLNDAKQINIDLSEGLAGGNILLNVDARFKKTETSGFAILLSTLLDGAWNQQVDVPVDWRFDFDVGYSFKLEILCLEGMFAINLNDVHLADYMHEGDLKTARFLRVYGDVVVNSFGLATQNDFSQDNARGITKDVSEETQSTDPVFF